MNNSQIKQVLGDYYGSKNVRINDKGEIWIKFPKDEAPAFARMDRGYTLWGIVGDEETMHSLEQYTA